MTDEGSTWETSPPGGRPGTVRGRFDWSETEPTVAVIETVAVATDQTPLDVYSLHDVIDTDALNTLVTSARDDAGVDLQVTFAAPGCEVTVHGDGLVETELVDDY